MDRDMQSGAPLEPPTDKAPTAAPASQPPELDSPGPHPAELSLKKVMQALRDAFQKRADQSAGKE